MSEPASEPDESKTILRSIKTKLAARLLRGETVGANELDAVMKAENRIASRQNFEALRDMTREPPTD